MVKSLPSESTLMLSLAQLCSQLHELEIEKDKFVGSEPVQGQAIKPASANDTSTLAAGSLNSLPNKIEAMKDEEDLKNIPLSDYPRCSHCKCMCCERRLVFRPDGTSTFWNNQPSFFDCSVAEKQRLLEDYKGESIQVGELKIFRCLIRISILFLFKFSQSSSVYSTSVSSTK